MHFKSKAKPKLKLNLHVELKGEIHGYILKMFLYGLTLELYRRFFCKIELTASTTDTFSFQDHFRIISCINNDYLRNIMVLNIFWRPPLTLPFQEHFVYTNL